MNTDMTMYQTLRQAEQFEDFFALSFMRRRIRLSQLIREIDGMACFLSGLGVKSDEVVAICLPNIPQAVIAFYAVNKLGAIANMIHPLMPPSAVSDIMEKTDSKFIFLLDTLHSKHIDAIGRERIIMCSVSDYLGLFKGIIYRIIKEKRVDVRRWPKMINGDAPTSSDARACAVYLHSGGTTGAPKTIMLSSKAINELAAVGEEMAGTCVRNKRMLSILPMFHGFGLGVCIHTALVNGGMSILAPTFSVKETLKCIKTERVNMIAVVPTILEAILGNKMAQSADLSSLEAVFCGGDSLSVGLKERFDELLEKRGSKARVMQGYGLTETVTVCCVNTPAFNRSGSVGRRNSNMEVKIVSDQGATLPVNTLGQICVAGSTVMLGYLGDEKTTMDALREDGEGKKWVYTGDLGSIDEDGYVWFKQRIKRIIKRSGVAVFPSEVEEVIEGVEGVSLCCVIGIPDRFKGERVKAFVVLKRDAAPNEEVKRRILLACREKLLRWAVPSEIEFRDFLPLTAIGKVDFLKVAEAENEAFS